VLAELIPSLLPLAIILGGLGLMLGLIRPRRVFIIAGGGRKHAGCQEAAAYPVSEAEGVVDRVANWRTG